MDNDTTAQVSAFYSDFSKEFDTVPHKLLISKLSVGGWFLDILYDYLSQRNQNVRIEIHTSQELQVTSGVPKGSLLGPLLFGIFMNSLPDVLTFSKTFIFGDDLKILAICKSNDEEVQTDIKRIGKWVTSNKMKLVVNKCHLLSFRGIRACLSLNGIPLGEPGKVKDLGVYFADKLNWSTLIEHRIEKAKKVFYCLRRNIAFNFKFSMKLGLYKSVILPVWPYGINCA